MVIYPPVPEDGPKLPAQTDLHQHVHILLVFEGLIKACNEGRASLHHDAFLAVDVLLLARVHNVLLLQAFKGKCAVTISAKLNLQRNQSSAAAHINLCFQ